jgi:hypothetical protein
LLNLPEDILDALKRENRLHQSYGARTLKEQPERQELLEAAITEDLSLNEIKERIKSLQDAKRSLQEEQPPSLKSRMDKAYAKIKKSKIWNDPKKKRQLEKLLGPTGSALVRVPSRSIQKALASPKVLPPDASPLPVFCRNGNWYWGRSVPRGVEPLPNPHPHPISQR